ncbi:MAG: hypothetical protein ACI84R_002658 [Candidatus Azotimanducaceae bacterium]|jgi:hypothetical protein
MRTKVRVETTLPCYELCIPPVGNGRLNMQVRLINAGLNRDKDLCFCVDSLIASQVISGNIYDQSF